MENIEFAVEDIQHIDFEDYGEDEYSIAKLGFLSTRPNSHKLDISEEVLRRDAKTVLGKWLVAKMNFFGTDATSHDPDENIVGIVPKDQDVEFVEDEDGYLRAYVDVVVSKIYAKDFCGIFEKDNDRAVSVEMKIDTENGKGTDDIVNELKIVGVTVLGKKVNPSCPESNIEFVRFAEEAESYFGKAHLTTLKKFAQDRKESMDKKTYKIDKSKESVSTKSWGDVDKTELRNKIMNSSNKNSLVKSVYLLVESGWEDSPSEHLKYPVMELKGDTFVYNRDGLASALGYAKKENETSVVNKIKKIYKSLGIDQDGKEGESKMAEIEFAAVDIGNLWESLYNAMREKYQGYDYGIKDIYEEDNQKFAIIKKYGEDNLYRLDFSLTDEGMTLAEEIVEVKAEFTPTDNIQKFAEPENVEQYRTFASDTDSSNKEDEDKKEKEEEKVDMSENSEDEKKSEDDDKEEKVEMSCDELKAKLAELESQITEKDNIIMQNNAELSELREFKKACMEAEKATKVEAVMSKVAEFMDESTAEEYRKKGMECDFSELSGWENEVKAVSFDKIPDVRKNSKKDDDVTRMSAIVTENQEEKIGSALERMKKKYC